jgi:GxxExxY protein
MDIESIAKDIVDAAIKVHRTLGPGLLESAYRQCHAHELRQRGYQVENEVVLPITYEGLRLDAGYRLDTWVERTVIVEHKAVENLLPVHQAQLLTYLKLSGCRLGFLLNWNVRLMKDGIHRLANNL